MKKYISPIIEIIELSIEDVITTSSFAVGGSQPGDVDVDFGDLAQ